MKILVIGSGGREHAIVHKISQSPKVKKIYAAPGNGGIAGLAECVGIAADNIPGLLDFASEKKIDLTVVGPEVPLTAGLVDVFETRGLRVFGPRKLAAELEGSKTFAKSLMRRYSIPTAEWRSFRSQDAALSFIDGFREPLVVKADGLCAGKGVYVCRTRAEAKQAVHRIFSDNLFGDAGNQVVVEECLQGQEVSMLFLTDGKTLAILDPSQDHKPIGDGDTGPNTGGMGAYSPVPMITPRVYKLIQREVLVPVVHALRNEEREFKGVLYAGLMITDQGPKVLEFNVRFGDPETQVILPRLKNDLVEMMEAVVDEKLEEIDIDCSTDACVTVVMASGGYPNEYEKGKVITGIADAEALENVTVYHAGTQLVDGRLVTDGGRVLNVTATGKDIREARDRAYEAVGRIRFDGAYFRTDIADKAIPKEKRRRRISDVAPE